MLGAVRSDLFRRRLILDRIGRSGLVLDRSGKGLGDSGALLLKRHRGIRRHSAVDRLLGFESCRLPGNIRRRRLRRLERRRGVGNINGSRLLGVVLLKFLCRALALGLGRLLLGCSLALGCLAGSSTLFLKVVNEFLALFECPLKEMGGAGTDRRKRGSDIDMGRRHRKLGRKIGVVLVGHTLRIHIVVVLGIIELLGRRGRRHDVQTGCGIDSSLRIGFRLDDIGLIGLRRHDRIGLGRGLERRLLALFVIERTGLGKHSQGTDGIRAKPDVAGGIAIKLGLGLDLLGRGRLLCRLGSGLVCNGLLGRNILDLGLGRDDANQGLVGRNTFESIDLLIKSLDLLTLGSDRLAIFILGIGRLFVLDGIAVIILLLGRGVLGCRARHLLGATLLLAKIRVKRNIVGELVLTLIGGDVIHDTQHGGNRRLVANRAGRVGKDKTIGNDIGGIGERHEGGKDRDNPQQDLQRAGKRQDAQDGNSRGSNRGNREQFGDQRSVRRIGLASEQFGARGVIVRDDDNRAIARRGKRARRLVVGDDVLAHARLAQARDHGTPGSLEHIEHGSDNGQQGAD